MSILPSLPSLNDSALSSLGSALDSSASQTPTSQPAQTPSFLGDVFQGVSSGISGGTGILNQSKLDSVKAGLSWSRIASFVIGVLLVGGGILMFRQTQVLISTGAKAGKRIGEIAAL